MYIVGEVTRKMIAKREKETKRETEKWEQRTENWEQRIM